MNNKLQLSQQFNAKQCKRFIYIVDRAHLTINSHLLIHMHSDANKQAIFGRL